MFFVGITSSLFPFLFLLGVVFVFSIQTSAQSLDDDLKLDEHTPLIHHVYCSPSGQSDNFSDYHMWQSDVNHSPGKTNEKTVLQERLCKLPLFYFVSETISLHCSSLATGPHGLLFWGLSPPYSI